METASPQRCPQRPSRCIRFRLRPRRIDTDVTGFSRSASQYWFGWRMKSVAMFQPAAGVLVADEWLALRYHPPSVLLIGTAEQTGPVIAGLLTAWPEPIEICQAANVTPDRAVRTLVVQDAGEMPLARQVALLEWMSTANDRRVIATARQPLFPRVESGEFSTALYLSPQRHHDRLRRRRASVAACDWRRVVVRWRRGLNTVRAASDGKTIWLPSCRPSFRADLG